MTEREAPMHIAVKICGLSTAAAVAGSAQWVGFNFYPPSPRAVTPQQAAALCALVPPQMRRVGLFVDADDAAIDAALAATPHELVQVHGRESAERVAESQGPVRTGGDQGGTARRSRGHRRGRPLRGCRRPALSR